MGGEKEFYSEMQLNDILKNKNLKVGTDISIFTTGSILEEVDKASEILENKGISVNIVDICSIIPLDKQNIIENLKTKKAVISVEEHSITGGIGSAICEIIAEEQILTPILRLGLNNEFAKGYGTHADVRRQNKLDAENIAEQIYNWLKIRGAL